LLKILVQYNHLNLVRTIF